METASPIELDSLASHLSKLPPQQCRTEAFLTVRNITYGDIGSRNPFDVLKAKKGTCSGKHALLKLLFERLGYEVRSYFTKHDFSRFPIEPWPQELAEFRGKVLTDYHDFLKINVDGSWLTIDAVFDADMKSFGFPVADWDGVSEMALPLQAEKIFPSQTNMEDHKKALIAALPAQVQQGRKAFLQALTQWLDSKR